MFQLRTVNAKISAEGLNLELVCNRDEGYYYFVGENTEYCETTSVMVYRLTHMSIDQWLERAREIRAEADAKAAAASPAPAATGLTPASEKLFVDLAKDSGNWSGNPMLDGNVRTNNALKGNVADLKKKGLIRTFADEGCTFVQFTDEGKALAERLGHPIAGEY